MGDPKGFLTLKRAGSVRQPVADRVRHWGEFYHPLPVPDVESQGARCMDCGVPFCHGDTGCPVRNVIPDWNDLVYRGRWRDALDALHATNNFPELTGRLCPAPCESACVLGLIEQPVAIRTIEQAIADRGFDEGWIAPLPPASESGKSVVVIGSGPAGLAAAQQLRRAGHGVVVLEREDAPGGLLRYGIPDFKLEKGVLDRRLAQLRAEGVEFQTGVDAGVDVTFDALCREYDAVCLALGASAARELAVPGRDLGGVHTAMDYLVAQNRRSAGLRATEHVIDARDKHVVVIGGGDTGSDCVGTAIRQGARSVRQFELLGRPPEDRSPLTPWPFWPMQLRTSHAHEEGGEREWSIATVGFGGTEGRVRSVRAVRVESAAASGGATARVPHGDLEIEADLVLLAMGFVGPTPSPLLQQLGVELDDRGTVRTDAQHRTSRSGLYAAGDVRRGASLIVWAIREGRDMADAVNHDLRRTTA
ncbi:MAG: glutamate synthase subunit beta [Gemmatimonadaceae bacterium]|nr:glutamate synthase subunit beta [Gemmatimonadaceae bacterium]